MSDLQNLKDPRLRKIYQNYTDVYDRNYFNENIGKWICEMDNIATPTVYVQNHLPGNVVLVPQNCPTIQTSKPFLTITTTIMVQENSPTKDAFRYS